MSSPRPPHLTRDQKRVLDALEHGQLQPFDVDPDRALCGGCFEPYPAGSVVVVLTGTIYGPCCWDDEGHGVAVRPAEVPC